MNNIIKITVIIVGLTSFLWGAKLIHYNYVHERDVTYRLKSGNENISSEITASHSGQAVKDLVVHLGLVVLGVCLVVLPLAVTRKAHNKSLKAGTPENGAP